jgi:hypothetical protein
VASCCECGNESLGSCATELVRYMIIFTAMCLLLPIPVVARSKAWVCDRLVAGIAGSNPAGAWMFVSCVYMLCCPV